MTLLLKLRIVSCVFVTIAKELIIVGKCGKDDQISFNKFSPVGSYCLLRFRDSEVLVKRFNPFKLADQLIERDYKIPIFKKSLVSYSGSLEESFMTADGNDTINLGEYLGFLRAWAMADKSEINNGIKNCPFCGGVANLKEDNIPSSYDGYYSGSNGYSVKCSSCDTKSGRTHVDFFSGFTKHSYDELKENMLLRIEENEKYEKYIAEKKEETINNWNKRVLR